MSENRCESCTMPIESGQYCAHCVDGDGSLLPFDETFERFSQWTRRNAAGLTDEQVEQRVYAFMASSQAWKGHPRVVAFRGSRTTREE